MENKEQNKDSKVTDLEHYDVNHPQNLNIPAYHSASEKRGADKIPAVENLNHQDGLKDQLKNAEPNDNQGPAFKNDTSLFGEGPKIDLGNEDKTAQDDEGIIRI